MAVGATLLGGALAFAGDYPDPVPVFTWLAPIPALVAVLRASPRQAAGLGALYGLLATGRVWLDFDVAPLVGRLAMCVIFVALHAWIFWTTRVLSAGRPALVPWVYASCIVLGELVRELPSTGQWWTLAATQVELEWLRSTASLGGSLLVSFLVALGSATVAAVIAGPRATVLASGLVAAATIGACVAWSSAHPPETGRSVRVAAVSIPPPADIAQRWYGERTWASADLWSIFGRYETATREAAEAGAELVVWREFGFGVPGADRARFDERVRSLARETDAVVVAGFIDGAGLRNLALIAAPDGSTDLYAKRHLVPMAESLWLEPGEREHGWLEYGDLRVALFICYDIDFGSSVREAARRRPNLFVAPSADWAGIHERHPFQGALRAVEHGIPLVRPAEGLSTLVDAGGAVVARASDANGAPVVLVDEVALGGAPTVYTAAGNWVVVPAVLLLAGSSARRRWLIRARRAGDSPPRDRSPRAPR